MIEYGCDALQHFASHGPDLNKQCVDAEGTLRVVCGWMG